jgi:hypothetical protein
MGSGRSHFHQNKPQPVAILTQLGVGVTYSVTQQKACDWCNVRTVIGPYVRLKIDGMGSHAFARL